MRTERSRAGDFCEFLISGTDFTRPCLDLEKLVP